MDLIYKLTKIFRTFPGIGERQARRFVFHLLSEDEKKIKELAGAILSLKDEIRQCPSCFRWKSGPDSVCELCLAAKDKKVLLVVEKDADLEVFRKADFSGKFFVLGGTIPLLEKELPKNINLEGLVEKLKKEYVEEVILAFSLTPLGEHTDEYVRKKIAPITAARGIKISGLGRGLSSGLELEYSDSATLLNALQNRN